jgi:hypothetical protein
MLPSKQAYWALLNQPWYQQLVSDWAKNLQSDGCTGVLDIYLPACWEHDIAYRLHQTVLSEPLTRREADRRFRWSIQFLSPFGALSPLSWWRWAGVRMFGVKAWKH